MKLTIKNIEIKKNNSSNYTYKPPIDNTNNNLLKEDGSCEIKITANDLF